RDRLRDRHPGTQRKSPRRRNAVLQETEGGAVNPEELHYTASHEWVRIDGDVGTIGITDYAQKELGEIVYLEMPEVGHVFNAELGTGFEIDIRGRNAKARVVEMPFYKRPKEAR